MNGELTDLYNPKQIEAVLFKDGNYIEAYENQGWQEYPKSIELWEKLDDGRLFRLKRWLSKSIVAYYQKTKDDDDLKVI